jgi:short-subunit dehydrogenase
MKSVSLSNKVVVITGASGGIGAGLARDFAGQGSSLVLAARSRDKLEALASEEVFRKAEVLLCPTDVTNPEQVKQMAEQTLQRFGRADILINNAGVAQFGSFLQIDLAAMRRVFEVNYWGTVYACREFIPAMIRRGGGKVVNILSTAGFHGQPHLAAYGSSKAALHHFSESLRIEFSREGIGVLEVHPGVIDNEFHLHAVSDNDHPYRLKQIRGANPKKLTHAIVAAIVRDRRELVYPRFWKFYQWGSRMFPRLMSWITRSFILPTLPRNQA